MRMIHRMLTSHPSLRSLARSDSPPPGCNGQSAHPVTRGPAEQRVEARGRGTEDQDADAESLCPLHDARRDRRRLRHRDGRPDLSGSKVRSAARTRRYRRPQQESPREERQLPNGPRGRPCLPQAHVRPVRRVRGGRLPLALHVHEPGRLGIGPTLRRRAKADEHPLARLNARARLGHRAGRPRDGRCDASRTCPEHRRGSRDLTGDLRRRRRARAAATAGHHQDQGLFDHAPTTPV
jgi:hypothetical protein